MYRISNIVLLLIALSIVKNSHGQMGCTDPLSCNYDSLATADDGSCISVDSILLIPDTNFLNALWMNYPEIDLNSDGVFQVCESRNYNGSLYLSNEGISDLTGIEGFINITGLWVDHNNLSYLDLSQNSALEFIDCSFNQLEYLNIRNGNNINLQGWKGANAFNAEDNPLLRCIIVDDPLYSYNPSYAYDWYKDSAAYYLTDCDGGDMHVCGVPLIHNTVMQYGSVTDHEGSIYKTITIGDQEWMAENLKVSTYRNGDSILSNLNDSAWQAANYGACTNYDGASSYDCPYGKLYNWYACADPAQICPVGWRIPSDEDWSQLVHLLDTNFSSDSYFGNIAAIALKSLWSANGNINVYSANNSSGFSGILAGRREYNGYYTYIDTQGSWWSITEETPGGFVAFSRSISLYYDGVDQIDDSKTIGLSVRCIRDENYVEIIPGCTDSAACNFDMSATENDSSCIYPNPFLDCQGSCINDTDLNGVCDEYELAGCQDSTACNYSNNPGDTITDLCAYSGCTNFFACNYNSNAACNDGSCTFPGCTDSTACNFNINAGCDDGSCLPSGCNIQGACNYSPQPCNNNTCYFPGCTDSLACNYSELAGCDDGSCNYPGCDIALACNYDSLAGCNDNSCIFPGCTDSIACNYEVMSGCDDGSCLYPGCNDSLACNYDLTAGCNDGSCQFPGCLDSNSCNYNPSALCDGGICLGQQGSACDDNDPSTINDVVSQDCICLGELSGCTDTTACNFNPLAIANDGSCGEPLGSPCNDNDSTTVNDIIGIDCNCAGDMIVVGCTDPLACNYNVDATDDDGSCVFALPYYNCDGSCLNDIDNDGVCNELEISGCTDSAACNFDSLATDDDGNCGLSVGAFCDDQDSTTTDDVIVVGCDCEGVLSLDEFNSSSFVIYPNPAQDYIVILLEHPGQSNIEIFNIAGEKVYTASFSRNVNISSLSQGVYFLRIIQSEKTAMMRFEVVR